MLVDCRKGIGAAGEEAAVRYLINNGYKIEARNFRCKEGEIDIVALDGSCTVFAEVKTRRSKAYGNPSECVNAAKQRHIINAAYRYTNGTDREIRFDVIEVMYFIFDTHFHVNAINHIKNAFTA